MNNSSFQNFAQHTIASLLLPIRTRQKIETEIPGYQVCYTVLCGFIIKEDAIFFIAFHTSFCKYSPATKIRETEYCCEGEERDLTKYCVSSVLVLFDILFEVSSYQFRVISHGNRNFFRG